ncbi:MAG: SMP-30/gluconolactonase/LRE family protein [Acidimicrobiales bacterium]
MRQPEFEVVAGPYSFTEGPVWDGSRILFTDIPPSRILAFDPATGETEVHLERTEKANGLALDARGRLYACQDEGRRVVRYEGGGSITTVADSFGGRRLNSPNDLSIDGEGRVWFSDPRYGPVRDDLELDHESVYLATPDDDDGAYRLRRATFDTTRPNGVLLSADEQTLFVAQTHMPPPAECRELRAYPIGPDLVLGDHEVVHDFGDHRGVDGMTIAPDGSLLVACGWARSGPGPRIAVFGPDRELAAEYPTEANPSNLCFGGPEGRDLYVTGASGCLWRLADLLDADGRGPWSR